MKLMRNNWQRDGREHGQAVITSFAGTFTSSINLVAPDIHESSWIVDMGASDHITPYIELYYTKTHPEKPVIVYLPNGTYKIVNVIGRIQLTLKLHLYNVVFIPSFKYNLLSVLKLLIDLPLIVVIDSNFYCFQD